MFEGSGGCERGNEDSVHGGEDTELQGTLKKILPRKNLYLYLARRTFTNLFLREYMPARDGRGTRKSLFVSASNSLGQGAMGGGVGGGTPSRAALQMSDETFRNYFSYLNRSAMLKRLDT